MRLIQRFSLFAFKTKKEGEIIPPWYMGMCYWEWDKAESVWAIIPINYLIRAVRAVRYGWNRFRGRWGWVDRVIAQQIEKINAEWSERVGKMESRHQEEIALLKGPAPAKMNPLTYMFNSHGYRFSITHMGYFNGDERKFFSVRYLAVADDAVVIGKIQFPNDDSSFWRFYVIDTLSDDQQKQIAESLDKAWAFFRKGKP